MILGEAGRYHKIKTWESIWAVIYFCGNKVLQRTTETGEGAPCVVFDLLQFGGSINVIYSLVQTKWQIQSNKSKFKRAFEKGSHHLDLWSMIFPNKLGAYNCS